MKLLILKVAQLRRAGKSDQSGLASMLVTGILISLIGLVAVGFAAVMKHEVSKSINNQISQTAYDAAQSGINDAISYLGSHPTTSATHCSDLTATGQPLASSSVLSSDGKTKYTCVLINPNPSDLQYQAINSEDSQVSRIDTSATLASMVVSWQANDRALIKYPATCSTTCPLYDETTWSTSQYAPMLRISIYPVPAATQDPNLAYAKAHAKTFFLYPIKDANSTVDSINFSTTTSGLKAVGCGSTDLGTFSGNTNYDCNVKLTGFITSSTYQYYADITPIYADTNVRIQANDVNNTTVTFKNTQAVIDVTAQSGTALKRLQARVDTSGQSGLTEDISAGTNGFSPFAFRSASGVCKRLEVPSSGAVYTDINTNSSCNSTINPPSPPVVQTTNADKLAATKATIHGEITPNTFSVTNCTFYYSKTQFPDAINNSTKKVKLYASKACAQTPASFGKGLVPKAASANISGLTQGTKYYFALCATFKGYKQVCDYSNPSFTTLNPIVVKTGGLQTTPKLPTWGVGGSVKTNGDSVTDCWFEWDNDSALSTYSTTGSYTNNGSNRLPCDQVTSKPLPTTDDFSVSASSKTIPEYNHDYYYELWAKYVDTDGATKWAHGSEYCFYALGKGSQPNSGNNYFNNHQGTNCQPSTGGGDGGGGGSGGGDGGTPTCYITASHDTNSASVVGGDCQPNDGNNTFSASGSYSVCEWLADNNEGCSTGYVAGTRSLSYPSSQNYGDQLNEVISNHQATFQIKGCDANGCSTASANLSW